MSQEEPYGLTAEEINRLPRHPDLEDDLGYELQDWDYLRTDSGKAMFLPSDPEQLEDDKWVVCDGDLVVEELESRA